MVLSCWPVMCPGRGRVGGYAVLGLPVPGRFGDLGPVVGYDGRTPVCSCVDVRVVPGRGRYLIRLGVCPGAGWRRGCQGPEADARGPAVAGAGGLAGFLDRVAVVPGAFDRAGATAVAALRVGPSRDLGQDRGQDGVPVLRGKRPPFRWRYGGPVVAFG